MEKKYIIGAALLATAAAVIFSSCKTFIPPGVVAVRPFDQKKYLGTWYEIARFDYRFEKNLDHVTATYSLKDNGTIKVDNKGYDTKKEKWKQSVGKAKPVGNPEEARLKVSFFGPFYSGYNVVALDSEYKYALVAGETLEYLWILSREKTIPEDVKQKYISIAQGMGYQTQNLIWVKQD